LNFGRGGNHLHGVAGVADLAHRDPSPGRLLPLRQQSLELAKLVAVRVDIAVLNPKQPTCRVLLAAKVAIHMIPVRSGRLASVAPNGGGNSAALSASSVSPSTDPSPRPARSVRCR
jgi:hypothetical protein